MEKVIHTDVQKILERLQQCINNSDAKQVIPPIYHAAATFLKYSKQQKMSKDKQNHFQKFYQLFESFAKKDFSNLKTHHKKILDQIAQIIQSQTFISCLRPDLGKIRHLRNSKTQIEQHIQLEIEEYDIQKNLIKTIGFSENFGNSTGSSFNEILEDNQCQVDSTAQQNYSSQLEELYLSIKDSYQNHCIDDAYTKTQEYFSKVRDTKNIPHEKAKFLRYVVEEYEIMTNFYAQFDTQGWIFDKEEGGVKLQYKVQDDMIAIRAESSGVIPIEAFLSIICEIDLMGEYVPFCFGCKQMKVISRNERIGTSKIYVPLLNDRETFFYAAGYDRIKINKSLFFFSKTINEDLHYQKKYHFKVPQERDCVRLQYKFFNVEYIPTGPDKARVRIATKIDMKMGYIPEFILFKSARIFAADYFKNILEKVKAYKGSVWQQKVRKNPAMYDFFRKRIEEYFLNNK